MIRACVYLSIKLFSVEINSYSRGSERSLELLFGLLYARFIGLMKRMAEKLNSMKVVFLGLLLLGASSGVSFGQTPSVDLSHPSYRTDYGTIKDIGRDLYKMLQPDFRNQLSPNPVWYKDDDRPYVRPFQFDDSDQPTRVVYVTEGFVTLANNLAHAKAIDKIEKGFFTQYIKEMAEGSGNRFLPDVA